MYSYRVSKPDIKGSSESEVVSLMGRQENILPYHFIKARTRDQNRQCLVLTSHMK